MPVHSQNHKHTGTVQDKRSLTLCRAMVMRDNMSTPMMMASTMIQVATVPSGIFPWNIVCTVTPSGLCKKESLNYLLASKQNTQYFHTRIL